MKAEIEKIVNFLVRSNRIVPIYFYVSVPLILRKSGLSILPILTVAIIHFLLYWWIKWNAYKKIYPSPKRYLLDITAMAVGLAVLYGVEVFIYFNTNTLNLALYVAAFVTYVPTLLSTQRIRNSDTQSQIG